MLPDDPRHGTAAGHSAHRRAGQEPCEPCRKAKARDDKLRRAWGHSRVPLGEDAWAIVRDTPLPLIVRASGVSECALRNILRRQGALNVQPDTRTRILNARIVTEVGLARRVQALAALGWCAREVARRAGVNVDNIIKLRLGVSHRRYVRREIREGVLATYDALHMTPAPESSWSKSARTLARRRGWVVPMAWDNIDDPNEQPKGVGTSSTDRADVMADVDSWGGNATDAARALGIDRHNLQKWCQRYGHSELYRRLAGREAIGGNQYTREDVA